MGELTLGFLGVCLSIETGWVLGTEADFAGPSSKLFSLRGQEVEVLVILGEPAFPLLMPHLFHPSGLAVGPVELCSSWFLGHGSG